MLNQNYREMTSPRPPIILSKVTLSLAYKYLLFDLYFSKKNCWIYFPNNLGGNMNPLIATEFPVNILIRSLTSWKRARGEGRERERERETQSQAMSSAHMWWDENIKSHTSIMHMACDPLVTFTRRTNQNCKHVLSKFQERIIYEIRTFVEFL